MKDGLCSFEIYLRTGIFQIEKYNAVISVSGIEFTPVGVLNQRTPFCILNKDIKSVFLYVINVPELEIVTETEKFIGNIKLNGGDIRKIIECLQKLYHNRFVVESVFI